MKSALIAAMLLTACPAFADADDDYVACLIGRAAVALHSGKDANTAQDLAYEACPAPPSSGDDEDEGLGDYVNLMVERMAAE
jgi:hypothetical protein